MKISIFKELWLFLKVRKKWWLLPILFIIICFSIILVIAETTALAPFIYPLI